MSPPREVDADDAAVDQWHPWPGLASFSEQTRAWFHGRDDEVAELARRVQRKLLTVLFGQSGLGKTSILRAGIVPRLREQGYCPVYVRVDYGSGAPPAAQQIKQAIVQATAASGSWTQSGVAAADESLWEFLHHRGDVLTDAQGQPVLPLLIFDQFEEIFTLAQGDDAGRRRAADFIAGLAELVENRPSPALEASLEDDDSAIDRFDFARTDYRVLIALREDYLAHLESIKGDMPSITQNRMRLAPMTGQQALAAVSGPGGALVSDEVAQAIVRFVAGGAELAHAQVEPSLLSLICRELNDKRVAAGRDTITLDLLAGSHASILSDFYERALADQPPAVRSAIEDVLLTESGYRENVAAERVMAAFAQAGAAPGALAALVDRRLLRIEERLDIRRVELTHDVLCGVVGASRAQRQEREAHAATAQRLQEQHERERTTRRTLVRTRQVAFACALLGLGAIGASLYAVSAKRDAQQARGQAENLIAYLSVDFAHELEGSGRQSAVANLDRRSVAYYDGLPHIEPGSETERNQATAMTGLGKTLWFTNEFEEAGRMFERADAILRARMRNGDASEASAAALAQNLYGQSLMLGGAARYGDSAVLLRESRALLAPHIAARNATDATRIAYADTLTQLAFVAALRLENKSEEAVEVGRLAMDALAGMVARDPRNASPIVTYVNAASFSANALVTLGRFDEAARQFQDAHALISKVLDEQPTHFRALEARADIASGLGFLELTRMDTAAAAQHLGQTVDDYATLTKLNKSNGNLWRNLSEFNIGAAEVDERAGRPAAMLARLEQGWEAANRPKQGNTNLQFFAESAISKLAVLQAELGERDASARSLALAQQTATHVEGFDRDLLAFEAGVAASTAALIAGDAAQAIALGRALVTSMEAAKAPEARLAGLLRRLRYRQLTVLGMAEYSRGKDALAETAWRAALAVPGGWHVDDGRDQARERAEASAWLAMSLARQNRSGEALKELAPVLALHRELAVQNKDHQLQRLQQAGALYALALADPAQRESALHEAQALLAGLPAAMRKLRSVDAWRARVADALQPGETHGR